VNVIVDVVGDGDGDVAVGDAQKLRNSKRRSPIRGVTDRHVG